MRRLNRILLAAILLLAALALTGGNALARNGAHAIALPLSHAHVTQMRGRRLHLPSIRQLKSVIAMEVKLGKATLQETVRTLDSALSKLLSPLLLMKSDPNKEKHAHRHRQKKSGKQKREKLKEKRAEKKKKTDTR